MAEIETQGMGNVERVEGIIRGHLKVGERWRHTATYGILREEWSGYCRSG